MNTQPFGETDQTIWLNWRNDWTELWLLICTIDLTVCSYSVKYAFQGEYTLYISLNGKELLPRNRHNIWSSSDCKGTRNHNHLVHKRILNHLAKLTKWLSWVVNTYLYRAFDCVFLSFHVPMSEWIHTLYLPECQESLCWKQAQYLKSKWIQRDSNPQRLC